MIVVQGMVGKGIDEVIHSDSPISLFVKKTDIAGQIDVSTRLLTTFDCVVLD